MINLNEFYGTENWYTFNLFSKDLLTDGTKYVAEECGAYWLFDEITAKCASAHRNAGWDFVVTTVTDNMSGGAELIFSDGNDQESYQTIEFTDFPFDKFDEEDLRIYSVWNGDHFVHMLPSEY